MSEHVTDPEAPELEDHGPEEVANIDAPQDSTDLPEDAVFTDDIDIEVDDFHQDDEEVES